MNTETIEGFIYNCKRCAVDKAGMLLPGVGPHWGKWVCTCGCVAWLPKPDGDPSKYKRENIHKDLVKKYSKGYCEMCLRTEEAVRTRPNETLEAHHVIPYQHGGSHERDNIWIVCTACHKYIEHVRRYSNQPQSIKDLCESFMHSKSLFE